MHIACRSEPSTPAEAPHPQEFTASIDQQLPTNPHDLTKFGRMLRRVERVKALYSDELLTGLNEILSCHGHVGVLLVSVGDISIQTDLPYCCQASVVTGETPGLLIKLARMHRKTLVLEEWAPLVELDLTSAGATVMGRHSGALPELGALTSSDIDAALNGDTVRRGVKEPHTGSHDSRDDALFRAIAQRRSFGTFVATDVGTSVRLCYPPYFGADAALALGSSPAVAAGAALTGRNAIAVVGDFGLQHSGIQALIEIFRDELPVIIIVMINDVQAQTGGQPVHPIDLPAFVGTFGDFQVVRWTRGLSIEMMSRELESFEDLRRPTMVLVDAS